MPGALKAEAFKEEERIGKIIIALKNHKKTICLFLNFLCW